VPSSNIDTVGIRNPRPSELSFKPLAPQYVVALYSRSTADSANAETFWRTVTKSIVDPEKRAKPYISGFRR
jgi:hypothetical protein